MFDKAKKRKARDKSDTNTGAARDLGASIDELLLDTTARNEPSIDELPEEALVLKRPSSAFYADEQVRKTFDDHQILEMAESLRANGQMQPIVVYPADENKRYKIDKGECRWRASKLIPGFELTAVVDPNAPHRAREKRIVTQLVENVQRNDVPLLDLAHALEELVQEGMTMETIAQELGWINRSSKKPNVNKVSRTLSVLKLPAEGKKLIRDGIVTDITTLEFLRKINDTNPKTFSVVCDLAREDDGLTRKRAEQEYKRCRSNENAEGKAASTPKDQAEPKDPATQDDQDSDNPAGPVIHVEWRGREACTLLLDRKHEAPEAAYVRMQTGDVIEVEVDDLKITRIEH